MKELWASLITTYFNYRGTGKGLTLFLVSVLIIYLLKREREEDKSCVNPFVFLLSPVAGIGYAFSLAFKKFRAKSIPSGVLTGLFVIITVMLSGGFVFSGADHYRTENPLHIKQEYVDIMDAVQETTEGSLRIVAPPSMSPYMKAYSERFDVMYGYPAYGDPANLSGNAGFVYRQMQLSTPDQASVVKALREEGYDHIIYDREKNFFELPFEEYGYELIGEYGNYKIYRDNTESRAASAKVTVKRVGALFTVILCFAFALLCIVLAVRSYGKRDKGSVRREKRGWLLQVLLYMLILCQIVGVIAFSYDEPAALPFGIYGKTGFTLLYSFLPIIMIPAYYYCYYLLSDCLFTDKVYARFMVLIICVINLWGCQSKPLLPATMLYCWFHPASVIIHGLLPLLLYLILNKIRDMDRNTGTEEGLLENDYYKWEEEEMKNHKIVNSRNLAITLIIVVILFAGSVFVMNRKINSLYDTTVNLQKQVEELRKSE